MILRYTVLILALLIPTFASVEGKGGNRLRADHPDTIGSVKTGDQKPFIIKLINESGDRNITIQGIRIKEGSEDFTYDPSQLPMSIGFYQPGNFKNLQMVFAPKTPGPKRLKFVIDYYEDDITDPDTLELIINAVEYLPQADFVLVSPNKLYFKIKPGGSDTALIRIRNRGSQPGYIDPNRLEFKEPTANFTIINTTDLQQPVQPTTVVTLAVRFTSVSPGTEENRLHIHTSSGMIPVELHGEVAPPDPLQIQPAFFRFDSVEIGQSAYDTVLVTNPNLVSIPVSDLRIWRPGAKNQFQLVDSKPYFMIPPQSSQRIILQFTPKDTLPLPPPQDRPVVHFDAPGKQGPYEIRIFSAQGFKKPGDIEQDITVSPSEIDFKNITIGKDSVAAVTINNPNSKKVKVALLKKPDEGFTIDNYSSDTIKIEGNDSAVLKIRYTPVKEQQVFSEIELKAGDKIFNIKLSGNGVLPVQQNFTIELSVRDTAVAVGTSFPLTITLLKNEPALEPAKRYPFSVELRYTSTVLHHADKDVIIQNGEGVVTLTGVFKKDSTGDILLKTDFMAALGDMPVGTIRISDFKWLDAGGAPMPTAFTADTAQIALLGTEGRLVNANQGSLAMSAAPNPAAGDFDIQLSNADAGAILHVYNMQGELVLNLSQQVQSGLSPQIITIAGGTLADDMYFVRLVSGQHSLVRTIFVQGK